MKDQIISIETARLAKKKGFNWPCLYYYTEKRYFPTLSDFDITKSKEYNWNRSETNVYDRYSAPTQSILQKWLREVHDKHMIISPAIINRVSYHYNLEIRNLSQGIFYEKRRFRLYEEALEEGLKYLLDSII